MDELLNEFNNTLDEFVSKLINQFPEEVKLKKYYQIYKMTKLYDKSLPIKLYMSSTINNKEKIKNKDDNYFLYESSNSFKNYAVEMSSFSSQIGLINKWKELSAISKNAIWDYIQTLFVIGEMFIEKNENAINQINLIKNNFTKSELDNIYGSGKISTNLEKILS